MSYASLSTGELLQQCTGTGESEAWHEFIRRFNPLIAAVVLRTARRWSSVEKATVDDLIQEVYLKLCADEFRLLRDFNSRHADAIFGYLKVVATNQVHDHYRRLQAGKRGFGGSEEGGEVPERLPDRSRSEAMQSLEQRILLDQIDQHLRRHLSPETAERDRTIFWLYYRQGLTAAAIAALSSRLTRLLKEQLIEHGEEKSVEGKGFRRVESL
jgi:RNA polymerase sigma-70 factor (ECF subfamily)